MSRVRARFLNGRDLDAGLSGQPAAADGDAECGLCSRTFTLLYPLAQYGTTVAGNGERLPVCDDCDDETVA